MAEPVPKVLAGVGEVNYEQKDVENLMKEAIAVCQDNDNYAAVLCLEAFCQLTGQMGMLRQDAIDAASHAVATCPTVPSWGTEGTGFH